MKSHTHRWTAVSAAMVALILGAAVPAAWAQDRDKNDTRIEDARPNVVKLKDARLKIELNATDQDAGIQVFIDSDPWKYVDIFDPYGKEDF